ncbi:hypothetical protein Tco_0664392 [Tanacetum coccineum]
MLEYEWKPPRCDLCKIFGHVHNNFPNKVSIPPIVDTPIVEKTNDGFQTVGKKEEERYEPQATADVPKNGATKKYLSLKAIVPPKEGNIIVSNSYDALEDESGEEIENGYDESANLLNSTKTGESSSTFTVAG